MTKAIDKINRDRAISRIDRDLVSEYVLGLKDDLGMTYREMGSETMLSHAAFWNWAQRKNMPDCEILEKIKADDSQPEWIRFMARDFLIVFYWKNREFDLTTRGLKMLDKRNYALRNINQTKGECDG